MGKVCADIKSLKNDSKLAPEIVEGYFRKSVFNSLIPVEQEAANFTRNLRLGESVRVTVTKVRNVQFHRKYFALINYAFDCFEPEDVEIPQYLSQIGVVPEKNIDRFRKDLTILAGYYDATIRVNGEIRLEAKSIAFGNMDEDTFNDLYQKTIDVVLKYVLRNFTDAELKNTVDGLMEFT
jgi:hypothetical protein